MPEGLINLTNISWERRDYNLRNGTLSAVHFGDISQPIKLVMMSANGFNALTYRTILEPLGIHAIALDPRGHGFSDLPADPARLRSWHVFKNDIVEFFDRYLETPVVLAGHSFGAVSGILAAGDLQGRLAGYVGFDPVTIPWIGRIWPFLPGGRAYMKRRFPIARKAGQRRFVFDSLDTAFARYQNRGAFKGFSDAALQDYLLGGLKPHPDGVQLACHPKWEQAIYVAQAQNVFKAARSLPANSHIIYGGKGAVSTRRTRAQLARQLQGGRMEFYKDFHHMFPLHDTAYAHRVLSDVLERA